MESSDKPTFQNGELVSALESVRALESLLDGLVTKVDDLEQRLGEAEERLEEIAIVREQD